MKLNLLPTYVSKGKQAFAGWIFAALLVLVSIGVTLAMKTSADQQLDAVKKRAQMLGPYAQHAYDVSKKAEDVIENAKGVILNSLLAQAMMKHNSAYPDFYDKYLAYIPSFFRISSATATPLGSDTASLTVVGAVHTEEQYRDLMLALNRIPRVVSVARSGFSITKQYVPHLVETDQTGRPIKPGESNVPDDPLERLNYYMALGRTTGYTGEGGFGSGQPGTKGAMPGWSSISVTIVVPADLETPNPKATLAPNATLASTTMSGRGATGGGGPAASGGPAAMGPGSGVPGGKPRGAPPQIGKASIN